VVVFTIFKQKEYDCKRMNKLFLRLAKYYWTFIAPFSARNRRPKEVQKQILITRFDGLGDFFLLLPFLQNLLLNSYKIVCIGNSASEEILVHLNLPITFLPLKNKNVNEFLNLLQHIKSMNFDYAFNLSMNVWGGIIVNQSRSRVKIGLLQEREHYVYKGANLFYDTVMSYPPSTHNFEVLQNIFTDTMKISPAKQLISTQIQNGQTIVIHPYANWAPRQWPHFLELINKLLRDGYRIKIIGTDVEHRKNLWFENVIANPMVSKINLVSINQLMTEIETSLAFIGNDSGPAHYAALVGKPTTVIWGPGYLERIHPVGLNVQICVIEADCRPCRQKGDVCNKGKNSCLVDICVEMVMEHFKLTVG
jgi:ADP-heptose:LPS heptosyltransferase